MSIVNTYPIFEPDQVLTNKHLNEMFNYLDEQERLTRCKLLGSGIVCGLEISHTSDTINITKGCGLTSQGFIILFCDHIGENGYKYYIPFTRPPFPNDIELITQCGPDPNRNNIPFYAPLTDRIAATANNGIFLLLTQSEFDALTDKTGVIALSQSGILNQYVVVLFLDVNELNLKNCDTNDCNDKGSMMDFEIKPLLVHKRLVGQNGQDGPGTNLSFQHIELRRYNVPVKNLHSTDDILNAFAELLDDGTLKRLVNDLTFIFESYKHLLSGITTNPFGSLADLKNNIDFILKFNPVLIQYYYDFIYDLIHALYEFRYRLFDITSECCGDEMRFPFHLALGEASVNTNANAHMTYRQYFVYSPLFDRESERSAEIRSLLMRMILMYQDFLLTEKALRQSRISTVPDIKVTPSQYGHHFLSERCIPYYYKVTHEQQDPIQEDLYMYWNFNKTRRGNAAFNLSYNAFQYNNADPVIHPLVYDIEWNNFFRIEGHIGRNINTALARVKSIQQNFNLPFDVVALSADYIGALIRGEEPHCTIADLESDYRILIAEFICRLHNAFCYIGKLNFTPPKSIFASAAFSTSASTGASAASGTATATNTISSIFPAVAETAQLIPTHPFISSLVAEFQATALYTKGNTLSRLCAPAADTYGNFYITSVARNNGNFVNPIPATSGTPQSVLPKNLFDFLDSVETMLKVLMTTPLADLNTTAFRSLYNAFEGQVSAATTTVLALLRQLEGSGNAENDFTSDYLLDLFVTNQQLLLNTCIVERLEALRSEYLRRVAEYRLAKNFNYYFKKHGGIEHKAGVPRGGTFILVYHEERRGRFVDLNSIFVNKELSNVLLSQFRELLQPDVELDTQEAKAKMLSVAALYRDPELYLRFKDVMQKYLDDCKDLPDDKRNTITTIINQPPAIRRFEIPNGAVIADFYVPYLCCSDCSPIAYVFNEEPTITIGKSFCRNDKGPYTIDVNPAGGVIKIDDKESDNQFVPSAFNVGDHTISYTVNNKTVTTTVSIVSPPRVKLSHQPIQNNVNVVQFTLETNAKPGAKFDWDYGDGKTLSTSDATQLSHEYTPTKSPQDFNVTLVVTDGPCKVTNQDKVTLTSTPIG